MNILILAGMAPLCAFYLYALVNFQKEIWRAKQNRLHGVETIAFNVPGDRLSDGEHDTLNGERQPPSRGTELAPQEVYSFELIYLGPISVAPTQDVWRRGASQRAMQRAEKSTK